jgi:putative oxidoreductase
MNLALWIIQALLAAVYLMAGVMKSTQPVDQLGKRMGWVQHTSPFLVRFIGVAEFLGAIGLILPMLTGVLPWLTVAAAVGLIVVQILAAIFHVSRTEFASLPMNLVLLVLAVVVAYGRFAIVPV